MEFQQIKKEIEGGNWAGVYFFFGEEQYPIDLLLKQIRQAIDPATLDFNYDLFSAQEVEIAHALSIVASFPMMAERRIVIIKDIQKFTTGDQKRLLSYVESPSDSTTLVLTAGKVDRRKSFYANLTKQSHWIECKPLYENQAVDWIKRYVNQRSMKITVEAALYLVQQTGTSLYVLANEIEKTCTYRPDIREIDLDIVTSLVGESRHYNTWEYTNAVADRNLKNAFHILFQMLENRQSPVGMIIDLTRRILLLTRIRTFLDQGYSPAKVTSAMHLRPYFAKLYLEQAKQYRILELQKALKLLLQTDHAIKTGYLSAETALTILTRDIIHGGKNFFNK